jgi:hydrogenase nickel incorporation protein HypA/HybF
MHELAVTQSLLETASDYAKRNNAKRVIALNLIIGDLSGIIDESVQFYWDFVSKDTICAESQLSFDHREAIMKCLSCGNEFEMGDELTPCAKCNSANIKVISGDEFRLDSIEIETDQ